MPVRFRCVHCMKRLQVSRRKIGSPVECPACGQELTVPGEHETSVRPTEAADSSDESATPHDSPTPHDGPRAAHESNVSYDDIDRYLRRRGDGRLRRRHRSARRGEGSSTAARPEHSRPRSGNGRSAAVIDEPVDAIVLPEPARNVLLSSRRATYVQAAILLVAALALLAVGFVAGRLSVEQPEAGITRAETALAGE